MSSMKNSTELILHPDGSIYHLKLKPHHVADTVILVGDPERVSVVSGFFDDIEHESINREIWTQTGTLKGKRITAMSTGMGPDNMDIVMNELDALVNIDLETREPRPEHRTLNIIRLGTSGALQPDIPTGSYVASAFGLGLDGILHFYKALGEVIEIEMLEEFIHDTRWPAILPKPYIVEGSRKLKDKLGKGFIHGITATSPGFYGPQGRVLRLELAHDDLNKRLSEFNFRSLGVTNYEMETAALYGLGKMLGHHTMTVCLILANRFDGSYLRDYKESMKEMIRVVLERLVP